MPESLQSAALRHVRDTQEIVRKASRKGDVIKVQTYLSQQHNLKTDEFYRKVVIIPSDQEQKISLQYFNMYGSKGHELSYGIGRKNISQFMLHKVVPLIESTDPIKSLRRISENQSIDLRMTTNFYIPIEGKIKELPGFNWHKDTPTNGDMTAIYSLYGDPVDFEIKNEANSEEKYSFTFAERSLLILSGDSRWKWLHRIVPKVINDSVGVKNERISLVFGFKI